MVARLAGSLLLMAVSNLLFAQDQGIRLAPAFDDHMVLQRDTPARVWGWATPGSVVTASIGSKKAKATVGADGRWLVRLPKMPAGGPYDIVFEGDGSRTLRDVLFGDVWICSGQSNMEMGIKAVNEPDTIATANYPQIRLCMVTRQIGETPFDTAPISWSVCTPENIVKGGWDGFSAAGYFFGREIHQRTGVPIGLVETSWGGTVAEAWTSAEALRPLGDFNARLDQLSASVANREATAELERKKVDDWYRANDPGTRDEFLRWPSSDDAEWKSMSLPATWEQAGLGAFDGVVWFRKEITLTKAQAERESTLNLGYVDDRDTTWINGRFVGAADAVSAFRSYPVPNGVLREGRNVIAVRVLDTGGAGGFAIDDPIQLNLTVGQEILSLVGDWKFKATMPLAKLTPPNANFANNPNIPTVLYNGMIQPLIPMAIKGAIWYQGESNAARAWQYRRLLPTMIRDWRARFESGTFPFYIVQLASWQARATEPAEHPWAELREAQQYAADTVGHSGIATAIDIGDAADIHPRNKKDVGLRLARHALAKDYGLKIAFSGPVYKAMQIQGSSIRLAFSHADGGLVPTGDRLDGFQICGEDKRWVWASARIDGLTVVVSSEHVAKPVAVRYAWGVNPSVSLYNAEGLPALPFRTDNFPATTLNAK